MDKRPEYFFDEKDVLVKHLYSKLAAPTLLKVQKSLYLLWAYYSATYGNLDLDNDDSEFSVEYPVNLFQPAFEAWRYGPVDNQVYAEQKAGAYSLDGVEYRGTTAEDKDIMVFLNDIISDINSISDFGLVERTHDDVSWKSKYVPGQHHIRMDPVQIKDEYIKRLEVQSEI